MKIVLQRVKEASCKINDKVVSQIGKGLLIFIGIEKGDQSPDVQYLAPKCINLRIFEDSQGKMNLSLRDIGGEVLAISQFTLCADCKKGLRPSFDQALVPDQALILYKEFVASIQQAGIPIKEGVFGKRMAISLVNDGPVTFTLSSK